jgi:3-oxoacyl-[acyl-carrier protein] reductase
MNITGKLEGKRALVTGAGTGIGREIAVELARQGADVVLHFSHDRDNAESASQEIKAMGRRVERVKADFKILSEVTSLAELTIEFLGGVDILVNNAGITFNSPFRKTTVEQFDTLVNVNLRGPFLLTQRIVDEMITNSARSYLQSDLDPRFAGSA